MIGFAVQQAPGSTFPDLDDRRRVFLAHFARCDDELSIVRSIEEDFLLKFVELSEAKEPQRQITTKDYLTVLAQIEGLLGQGSTSEMALVSILINGKGEGSG